MQLGLIGLGKMGGNMAERLHLGGHQVVGFDFSAEAVARLTASGNVGASTNRASECLRIDLPAVHRSENRRRLLSRLFNPTEIPRAASSRAATHLLELSMIGVMS